MNKTVAIHFVGTLSNPSKMPGKSIGLPAKECITGSKLRAKEGSVCSKCYAMKGCYTWGVVQKAQYNRLDKLKSALDKTNTSVTPNDWITAMVSLIGKEKYFRWHDSGDIQSFEHLWMICQVAKRTPNTKHWLPTKEAGIIRKFLKADIIPDNLCVRVSSPNIDQKPIKTNGLIQTSTVHTRQAFSYECPAYQNAGKCGECRACWNKTIDNVSYPKH